MSLNNKDKKLKEPFNDNDLFQPIILLTVHIGNYMFDCFSQINLTSIRHQQLLRGGMPVRVLVLSWSDNIDAVSAFKYMPGYSLTYVMRWLRPDLRSVLTVS